MVKCWFSWTCPSNSTRFWICLAHPRGSKPCTKRSCPLPLRNFPNLLLFSSTEYFLSHLHLRLSTAQPIPAHSLSLWRARERRQFSRRPVHRAAAWWATEMCRRRFSQQGETTLELAGIMVAAAASVGNRRGSPTRCWPDSKLDRWPLLRVPRPVRLRRRSPFCVRTHPSGASSPSQAAKCVVLFLPRRVAARRRILASSFRGG
jgi:hypothetical protein